MNAIKLHGQNQLGIPADWPTRRQPLPEKTAELPKEFPASDGWFLMTDEEYDRYVSERRVAYYAAIAALPKETPVPDFGQVIAGLQNEVAELKARVSAAEEKQALSEQKLESVETKLDAGKAS